MDLKDYLKQVLQLEADPTITLVEEEPAFTFTLEERQGREEGNG